MISSGQVIFRCSSHPKFHRSRLTSKILSESRLRFTSSSWKIKNETGATFLDVYGVFASKFCHFPNSGTYFKVIQLFKAKMDAFRDKSLPKVENDIFLLHLTPNFLERDGNGFLASSTPKPCANQCFRGHFARRGSTPSSTVPTCSLWSINPLRF